MTRNHFRVVALALLGAALSAAGASAENGIVLCDAGGSSAAANSLVVSDLGEVYCAGSTGYPANFFAMKLLFDGRLDPLFAGGFVATDVARRAGDSANACVLQGGKLVSGGAAFGNFVLVRYNADGTLDKTFGSGKRPNGIVISDFGASEAIYGLALQADQKILAAGRSGSNVVLARYTANGILDSTFGTNGKTLTSFGVWLGFWQGVQIHGDGILVATSLENAYFGLARHLMNGELDTSFGVDGKVVLGITSCDTLFGMAVDDLDGSIFLASESSGPTGTNPMVTKLTQDGLLDTSFGGGTGYAFVDGVYGTPHGIALQPDGKIVVAGSSGLEVPFVARFDADGTLDTSFGNGLGWVETDVLTRAWFKSVAIDPAGNIVAAGVADDGTKNWALVARYLPDGTLDPDF